ncbi:hypothetical protein K438DRAFT_2146192 [Mycena galopus ATCC 62051]|nr:hypothetical protein K438DRAFT_2146192 [Mycena galopus ATCC 62051]
MSSLISAVLWVKRGITAQNPPNIVLSRVEKEDARIELEGAHEAAESMGLGAKGDEADDAGEDSEDDWVDEDAMDVDSDSKPKTRNPDVLSEYNLDDYDNDRMPFSNIKGLTYYRDNEEDPYITLKGDDTDDERDELEVLPTDHPLIGAKNEDEISQLQIYVYDESQEKLYVCHDLVLPNFPLCLEWLDFSPAVTGSSTGFGNYIAVASILGRPDETKPHIPIQKKNRTKTKHCTAFTGHYVDAVLALNWNKTQRNLLATVGFEPRPTINGDGGGPIRSFDNDRGPSVLLTGSYDCTVRTFDLRAPDTGEYGFYVSLENDLVLNFNVRTLPSDLNLPSPAKFTLSALDVNPRIRGCIATGGNDKLVKVWNVLDEEDGGRRNVSLVISRDLSIGKVFSTVFSLTICSRSRLRGPRRSCRSGTWLLTLGRGKPLVLSSKRLGEFYGRRGGEGNRNGVVGVVSDDEESGGEDDE